MNVIAGISEAVRDEVTFFLELMRKRTPGGTPGWFYCGSATTLGVLLGLYATVEATDSMPINAFIILMSASAVSIITLTVLLFQTRPGRWAEPPPKGYWWKVSFIALSLYLLIPIFVGMFIGMPIGQFIL